MKQKLYIPKEINVGYQVRQGTYTGKLAYVVYRDDKGKLRKEASWNSWRHKPGETRNVHIDGKWTSKILGDEVAPEIFENVPTEGFVLNKGVGGSRESYGWNPRNEYIRIFDPRGFEFEITVANLLFILQESTSAKGKGLEGEFVYSWDGKDLVLLPVGCYEYKQSTQFTNLQSKKVTKDDIVIGGTYLSKKQESLIYLGRFDWFDDVWIQEKRMYYFIPKKKHIFYNVDTEKCERHDGYTKLGAIVSLECASNYAELVELFMKSKNASEIDHLEVEPKKIKEYSGGYYDHPIGSFFKEIDGKFYELNITSKYEYKSSIEGRKFEYYSVNAYCVISISRETGYLNNYRSSYHSRKIDNISEDYSIRANSKEELEAIDLYELVVVTKNGGRIPYRKYQYNY